MRARLVQFAHAQCSAPALREGKTRGSNAIHTLIMAGSAVPRLLTTLVRNLYPEATSGDVDLAFDLVGSLLSSDSTSQLPKDAMLSSAESRARSPSDTRRFESVKRRLQPMALSEQQL